MRLKPLTFILVTCLVATSFAQFGGERRPQGPGGPPGREKLRFSEPILQKAFEVQNQLKFFGVRKSVIRLGDSERRNTERVWREGMNQRVEFERGSSDEGQVIVLKGGQKWHYFKSTNEIQVKPARFEDPLRRLAMMLSGRGRGPKAEIEVSDGGNIAKIKTKLVKVLVNQNSVIMKMWIDPNSGLILKREIFDPTGRLVGSSEFTKVDFSANLDKSDFELRVPGASIVPIGEMISRTAKKAGVPAFVLKPGMDLELDSVRLVKLDSGDAVFQSYISERGRLSLVVSKTKIDARRLKSMAGKNNATAVFEMKGVWITLITDSPQHDLDRIRDMIIEFRGNMQSRPRN